jgi:uncharacterized protein (TIGR02145 family)
MADNMQYHTDSLYSWCYEKAATCPETGRLYTWEAAVSACEGLGDGWRLPTDQEWMFLATDFGGFFNGGKEEGNPAQAYKRLRVGGSSGFDALLGGYRKAGGSFYAEKVSGLYWTATEWNEDYAWRYEFFKMSGGAVSRYYQTKTSGYSCRCVKERIE